MDLNFSIDIDAESIEVVVDNAYTIKAAIDDDGSYKFVGLHRLDNDELADLIKSFSIKLFNLEGC